MARELLRNDSVPITKHSPPGHLEALDELLDLPDLDIAVGRRLFVRHAAAAAASCRLSSRWNSELALLRSSSLSLALSLSCAGSRAAVRAAPSGPSSSSAAPSPVHAHTYQDFAFFLLFLPFQLTHAHGG